MDVKEPDLLVKYLKDLVKKDGINDMDLWLVKKMCESGYDVNARTGSGVPAIELAVKLGHRGVVQALCARGATVTHKCLVTAVKLGDGKMLSLLTNHGAPIDQIDHSGTLVYDGSALQWALNYSDTEMAKALLKRRARIDIRVALMRIVKNRCREATLRWLVDLFPKKSRDVIRKKCCIFHEAVSLGNAAAVSAMLSLGADVNGVYINRTPLIVAASPDVVSYLKRNGAIVTMDNATSSHSRSLYPISERNRIGRCVVKIIVGVYYKIVKILIEHGADLNARDNLMKTALILSAGSRFNTIIFRLLLKKGADVNVADISGDSALHVAAFHHDTRKVKALLKHGAKVNTQNEFGRAPLHCCLLKRSRRCFHTTRALLEQGADVHLQDCDGNTPLLIASETQDDPRLIELLIQAGSDVNRRNNQGATAIQMAARHMKRRALLELVNAGADLNVRTDRGRSILMEAASSRNEDAIDVFLERGADVNFVAGGDAAAPVTALSILLNKWYPEGHSQGMALKLLHHGATALHVRHDVLHRLIAMNSQDLILKLIASGLCPTDIALTSVFDEGPVGSFSPLSCCIITNNLHLATRFVDNWFLTESDVAILRRRVRVGEVSEGSETFSYVTSLTSQPPRLQLLSFLAVSAAVGSGTDRRCRIKNLPVPGVIKERLLYSKIDEDYFNADDVDDDDDDDDDSVYDRETAEIVMGLVLTMTSAKHARIPEVDPWYVDNDVPYFEALRHDWVAPSGSQRGAYSTDDSESPSDDDAPGEDDSGSSDDERSEGQDNSIRVTVCPRYIRRAR